MSSPKESAPRIALSHDWLLSVGGGERCLAIFADLYPDAKIYTSIHKPESMSGLIDPDRVVTSYIDRMPGFLRDRHRMMLPLMPSAFRSFDPGDVDLILSSSHCAAKGIRSPDGAVQVCYCYSPMRYVWDLYETYRDGMKGLTKFIFSCAAPQLRRWDKASAENVDVFVAISRFIAERIKRIYDRDSVVIYPPVDCSRFTPGDESEREDHFLVLSRLVSYKRVDLAVKAFRDLPFKLRVVGTGPQEAELKASASDNVEFSGFVPEENLVDEYRRARAVIVTAVEDFGLVPVEAAACGTPSIALIKGGYLETIREGVSGLFFNEQTPVSLRESIKRFDSMKFNPDSIRFEAMKFDVDRFRKEIADVVSRSLGGFTT